MTEHHDVVVIGGGMGGLFMTKHDAGITDVVVLEGRESSF